MLASPRLNLVMPPAMSWAALPPFPAPGPPRSSRGGRHLAQKRLQVLGLRWEAL